MTDRQRLEAVVSVVCKYLPPDGIDIKQAMNEIIGLIDPLPPQRTEQEPVAWVCYGSSDSEMHDVDFEQIDVDALPVGTMLYTTPPQREFVGLTDEEIKGVMALDECWLGEDSSMPNLIAFARAVLRKAQKK
jgi:hypothetical protein